MAKENTKDAFLIVRLSSDLKKQILKEAQKAGTTLSDLVRPALEKLVK